MLFRSLVFFDVNHCRGTDIKLPKCHGLLTLNNFNISVDTLQSIYRLRQINSNDKDKIQTIDYYYSNIEQILSVENIKEYLENQTLIYNKNKEKEFYKQCIKSQKKFNYDSKKFQNIYLLEKEQNYIYPKTKKSSYELIEFKKDLENENYYEILCSSMRLDNIYCNKLKESLKESDIILISQSQSQSQSQ